MDRETTTPDVDSMPGSKAKRWVDFHQQFAAPSTYVYDFVWDVTAESEGPFCVDVDGNVLMDFTSHVAAAPLGYNNPKIMDQLDGLDVFDPSKIAGQDFYASAGWPPEDPEHATPTQLMERITSALDHYDMDTVFLSNTGAEAVENAIKVAYQDRDAHRGVTFEGAFHGRTLGALSLNRSKTVHRKGYPEVPGIMSVPYCSCRGECECGWRTNGPGGNVLADRLHPERGNVDASEVAYVILEPVQGEGGYRVPNDDFVDDVAHVRDEYGIHVISDEIQAGLGRTGEMWGIDHVDLEPDVVASAKGLRVGATVANADVFPDEEGRLSSTWGAGDVISAAQGVATLDAIHEHDLLENVRERGRQLREIVEDADADCVTDVRGRALMFAVEFDTKDRREAVVEEALKRGLLTLGCGYKSLRLLPPLDVTEREIELGASIFLDAVAAAGRDAPMATSDASDGS